MRVFSSNKYEVVGYSNSEGFTGWVLRERVIRHNYTPVTIIADEIKFVIDGKVYFLKRNGVIEDNKHESLQRVDPASINSLTNTLLTHRAWEYSYE